MKYTFVEFILYDVIGMHTPIEILIVFAARHTIKNKFYIEVRVFSLMDIKYKVWILNEVIIRENMYGHPIDAYIKEHEIKNIILSLHASKM